MKKEESFEELLNKLETITSKLEKEDDISLEESMKLFEEGIDISKKCNKQIEEAEKKQKKNGDIFQTMKLRRRTSYKTKYS